MFIILSSWYIRKLRNKNKRQRLSLKKAFELTIRNHNADLTSLAHGRSNALKNTGFFSGLQQQLHTPMF